MAAGDPLYEKYGQECQAVCPATGVANAIHALDPSICNSGSESVETNVLQDCQHPNVIELEDVIDNGSHPRGPLYDTLAPTHGPDDGMANEVFLQATGNSASMSSEESSEEPVQVLEDDSWYGGFCDNESHPRGPVFDMHLPGRFHQRCFECTKCIRTLDDVRPTTQTPAQTLAPTQDPDDWMGVLHMNSSPPLVETT